MRRSHRANHASRTARRANAFQIQRHQHRFRINADKAHVERVCELMSWITVLLRVWKNLCDTCPEIITQLRLPLPLLIGVAQDPLGSRCHPCDAGDVFCSGAALIFVRTPEHDWLNRQTASQEKESRSLRAIKFVRGKTAGID